MQQARVVPHLTPQTIPLLRMLVARTARAAVTERVQLTTGGS